VFQNNDLYCYAIGCAPPWLQQGDMKGSIREDF